MSRNNLLLMLAAATLVGAGLFGACSSSGSGTLAVNARTGPTAAASQNDGGTPGGVELGNDIALDRVRILVRKLELLAAASPPDGGFPIRDGGMDGDNGGMDGDGGHEEDDAEDEHGAVVRGPFLVDLSGTPLAGGIHEAFDTQVPMGTYEKACFVVNTVSQAMASQDAGIAAMQALHASIAIDGTIDGQPFGFTTPFRVAQCHRGTFTVGTGTTELTFDVNYRGWFTGEGGGRLDPRLSGDRGAILENIRCSIRLFPDAHGDGDADDGDKGEDDEGREGCPVPPMSPATDGG
jgi:hypothetical protein